MTGALTRFLLVLSVFAATAARAVVLDWNNVSWTSGNLSKSFDIDSSNSGNDVTIAITGNTSYFKNGTPDDTTDLTGGHGSSQQSLFLNMDYSNRSQAVTVTIGFHYSAGVDGVYFTLFDVDSDPSSYVDKISSIIGKDVNGNNVAATIITSPNNTLVGSGTSQYVIGNGAVGANSSNGNVYIYFSTTVTQVSFNYGNDSSAPGNPGNQYIGLYDISYTKHTNVPEVHPGLIAAFACLGFIGIHRWRNLRAQSVA